MHVLKLNATIARMLMLRESGKSHSLAFVREVVLHASNLKIASIEEKKGHNQVHTNFRVAYRKKSEKEEGHNQVHNDFRVAYRKKSTMTFGWHMFIGQRPL